MHSCVLLRTHKFDEQIRVNRDHLRGLTSVPVRILLHDATGSIQRPDWCEEAELISFSDHDMEACGLPVFRNKSWGWHLGDYPLYYFFTKVEGFDYALMVEYDAKVNFDIDQVLAKCIDKDFVAAYAGFRNPDWVWAKEAARWFDDPRGSYFPVVGMSCRMADAGIRKRQSIAREWVSSGSDPKLARAFMPHCEVFVPSLCYELDFAQAPIHELVPSWKHELFTQCGLYPWESAKFASTAAIHPCFLTRELPSYFIRSMQSPYIGDATKRRLVAEMESLIAEGILSYSESYAEFGVRQVS